ncbi:hypothetical protein SAY87_026341 [Trapa incisa]|uniref:Uncharacterized protein n=1 Tax=Trapa incisa TaxID=236973 RepID=A0AAN7GRU1_9MYRT|nr:hypothetical protein SAY87_026341 [Trapa incisa]
MFGPYRARYKGPFLPRARLIADQTKHTRNISFSNFPNPRNAVRLCVGTWEISELQSSALLHLLQASVPYIPVLPRRMYRDTILTAESRNPSPFSVPDAQKAIEDVREVAVPDNV